MPVQVKSFKIYQGGDGLWCWDGLDANGNPVDPGHCGYSTEQDAYDNAHSSYPTVTKGTSTSGMKWS